MVGYGILFLPWTFQDEGLGEPETRLFGHLTFQTFWFVNTTSSGKLDILAGSYAALTLHKRKITFIEAIIQYRNQLFPGMEGTNTKFSLIYNPLTSAIHR